MSQNVVFIIEYVGTNFHGWQMQPGMRTLQGELERILAMLFHKERVIIHTSGRTDSGVHARAQVISALLDITQEELPTLARSISNLLRGEVCVRAIAILPKEFHPRYSAERKQYEYKMLSSPVPPTFNADFVYWTHRDLNIEAMAKAASVLIGEHDFVSFQGSTEEPIPTVKTIYRSEFIQRGQEISYLIEGNGFLKQMVRNIVGSLIKIGEGKKTPEWINDILAAKDRRVAGPTAPAHGLFLNWVLYQEFRSDEPWGKFDNGLIFRS